MTATKRAVKRKGRPVTREAPAAGKRTQLSVAISQPLKRQLVKEAKTKGRSISAETEYGWRCPSMITEGVLRPVRAEMITPLGQMPVGSGRPRKPIRRTRNDARHHHQAREEQLADQI